MKIKNQLEQGNDSRCHGERRKVLITGGTGTVGQAFMHRFADDFEFINVSRNKSSDAFADNTIPRLQSHVADIQHLDELCELFESVKPDIVIHAAAMKHVNIAEMNPSQTVEVNIVGSLNVAKASMRAKVPVVVGVSTDKACQPENIYGYSKKILEQTFLEHFSEETRFVCVRFANVACSQGSVIPFWIDSARRGDRLKLTDSRMTRLMFTSQEASDLIRNAIDFAEESVRPFVLCQSMKSVGLLDLANLISTEFGDGQKPEIIGPRPGEKLNETLVSQCELEHSSVSHDERYIFLQNDQFGSRRLTQPLSSLTADYMSEQEMRCLYADYKAALRQQGTGKILQHNRAIAS